MSFTWKEMPSAAMIEVTNACNFSCTMCANNQMKRKKGLMSLELFNLVLDRCEVAKISFIKLYTVGESFLHPQFIDMFRLAALRNFKTIAVSTNGALLKEEHVRELVKTGKCVILYSFAGWDKNSYEARYKGGVFEEAIEKIKLVNRIVREARLPRETLKVRGVVSKDEEKQNCAKFFKHVLGLEPSQISIVVSHNWAGKVLIASKFSKFFNTIFVGNACKSIYCFYADTRIGILFDGRVTACGCLDINADLVIGDIREQSIQEIRQGPKFQELFNRFKHGDLRGLICYNCNAR